jgi:hypothetical protein
MAERDRGISIEIGIGNKRIRVLASAASAAEVETIGKFCQLLPLFAEL